MYNYMIGKIISAEDGYLVLDTNGIGYEIIISDVSLRQLGSVGDTVKVFTYLHVREDEMSLFGFASKQEKQFFLRLISISGIGPKVAVGIMGYCSLDTLLTYIAAGDTAALGKIKGIGKKTAERIVLELKDKIGLDFEVKSVNLGSMSDITIDSDAVEALKTLGYSQQEATQAVAKVYKEGMSTEQVIMQALKG